MTRFIATVVFLVVLLAPTLAAANVPDPTWIAGMYDGGDADEILTLVWDGAPGLAAHPPALLEPQAVVLVSSPLVAPAPAHVAHPAVSRAPPLV